MKPSSETIKHRRQFFGILAVCLLLIGINSLAYSLMQETQVVISEKSYTEETIHIGTSSPPGISSNVQDEGAGIESKQTMTTTTTVKEN
ncbi:MAG: hypothetical protein P9L94_15700 [Candidatus Hinthialibacter antarcticus]|nr:hypothetical protein [Candidatus Hinthialibacter antarcticus]